MNLINAILLLVHFLIMPNLMCSFYAYVYVFYEFTFCLSVLFSLFCKHVRLSCVFLNKLKLKLTKIDAPASYTLQSYSHKFTASDCTEAYARFLYDS